MSVVTACVVDNDALARAALQQYIQELHWFRLGGIFDNASAAKKLLQNHPVDVLFIDIQLSGMIEFVDSKFLMYRPQLVFTSTATEQAPNELAVEPIGYLTKPIAKEHFTIIAEKINRFFDIEKRSLDIQDDAFIYIRQHRTMLKLAIEDILFVEAIGDYLKIHTNNSFYSMLGTLKQMEEKLLPYGFFYPDPHKLISPKAVNSLKTAEMDGSEHQAAATADLHTSWTAPKPHL